MEQAWLLPYNLSLAVHSLSWLPLSLYIYMAYPPSHLPFSLLTCGFLSELYLDNHTLMLCCIQKSAVQHSPDPFLCYTPTFPHSTQQSSTLYNLLVMMIVHLPPCNSKATDDLELGL